MIRALDENDVELIKTAYYWRDEYPYWFRESMAALGEPEWEGWWEQTKECLNYGIFEGEMVGLISLVPMGQGRVTAHINVKRGTDPEKLAYGAFCVRDWLFKNGIKEIFAWVASVNGGMKKLCRLAGLDPDTVTMIKGTMRNKLVVWERFSARAT